MTNKEAVIAAISVTGHSDSGIEKTLLDAGIDGSTTYDPTTKSTINLCALDVLKGMLAMSSVTEGDYSISYSVEGIKARIGYLEGVEGISGQPKVIAVRLW